MPDLNDERKLIYKHSLSKNKFVDHNDFKYAKNEQVDLKNQNHSKIQSCQIEESVNWT